MTRAPAELRVVADLAGKALATAGVPAAGDGVAVAVSGGADSLALLHALRVLAGPRDWRLAVLTVDHGLRPGSAADAAFVADHAKSLGLPARLLTLAPADLEDLGAPVRELTRLLGCREALVLGLLHDAALPSAVVDADSYLLVSRVSTVHPVWKD